MHETFGERLHAAMLAAGITEPRELAKRCGVNGAIAIRWLVMEEAELPAHIAYKLARGLNVRVAWLISGEDSMPFNEDAAEAFRILNKMPSTQIPRWLRAGRRIIGEKVI